MTSVVNNLHKSKVLRMFNILNECMRFWWNLELTEDVIEFIWMGIENVFKLKANKHGYGF